MYSFKLSDNDIPLHFLFIIIYLLKSIFLILLIPILLF